MEKTPEYTFKIGAYTPSTIPMSRLANYMQELASLFGEKEHVHLVDLKEGSTILSHRVDQESIPKVHARIASINPEERNGKGDALRAYNVLDRLLSEDNASGYLYHGSAQILYFPGCAKPKPLTFKDFTQPGSLDGSLIRIGGKSDPVPVLLQEDNDVVYKCQVSRSMACDMAQHLFVVTLRVYGTGKWERNADGNWTLKHFDIADFKVLDDTPLDELVKHLRKVPGNGWKDIDDPYAELQRLRHGTDEAH